jgi:flagellar protein FliS
MNTPSHMALARYGTVKVTTSSPGQLLLMLYDGLFRFLREAQAAMVSKDRARAGGRLGRAQAILGYLLATLDTQHAPDLCDKLQGLYSFSSTHLLKANIEQSPAKIGEVIQILGPLQGAWVEAVASVAART